MGVRLEVIDKENRKLRFYGTKHYGYVDDFGEYKLPSFKYLVEIGIYEDDIHFFGCCVPEIELTSEQFKKFIDLYNKELNELYDVDLFKYEPMKELYENNHNKLVSWG